MRQTFGGTVGYPDHYSHAPTSNYGGSRYPISARTDQQRHPQQQQQQFSFNKVVFDQQVMFRVRQHQREDFTMPLGLKISLQAQSNQSQTLVIDLTDEQDPLFLHQMVCTE